MSQLPSPDQIPITKLGGVGQRTAERLAKLDIHTVQDMLFHLPSRYQNRTRITPIATLRAGMEVVIEGHVVVSDVVKGRRRSLLCRLEDNTGIVSLRFFYFNAAQRNNLQCGARIRCFGEVRRGATGLELYHPEYTLVRDDSQFELEQRLTPIYPTTDGITQNKLRQLAKQALKLVEKQHALEELIPAAYRLREAETDITQIVCFLHQPPVAEISERDLLLLEQQSHPMQQKLAFEELIAHQLSMLRIRRSIRLQQAPRFQRDSALATAFIQQLPFDLTSAQQRVSQDIAADLAVDKPMLRLIQGDVGSGKTVVAALAALQAVAAGYQVAIMAPTEILAEQHFKNFQQWMRPLKVTTAWITGKQTAKQRREQQQALESGEAQVVIGTHALFQKEVKFCRLGLIIIDEQHRFGVHQRLALREKGTLAQWVPHQLIMTATPIPRTLAMCAYADLDCSVIDELPPGRKPVETLLIGESRRSEVITKVRRACEEGRQVYWVCTLIEESEALQCQAAEVTAEMLGEALPELKVGLIHGRLKSDQKAMVMENFSSGNLHLLVATTVIEVGVDVPNASLMIIENPERLGLAQLHQLRGRVGRGSQQSYCILMYSLPLSANSKQRLSIMRQSQDGFVIAEKDLELRGPGEVLGTRQTGIMEFKIADMERDSHLISQAQECAQGLLKEFPMQIEPLIQRWLGSSQKYGQV